MGRPLNKKFFGDGAGRIACLAEIDGNGSNELCYIVSQRSNSKYFLESESGPATRSGIATLVAGVPTTEGEMQVVVTPEGVGAGTKATFDISTDGAGLVSAVVLLSGGSGYIVPGNFLITDATLTGNDDAQINYTVSGGAIDSASVDGGTSGTGYTINQSNIVVDPGDVPQPSATDTPESAKIINARTVKTFEGNTYMWPAVGGAGTGKVRREANLQSQ